MSESEDIPGCAEPLPAWLGNLFAAGVITAAVGAIATLAGYFSDTFPATLAGSILMTIGTAAAAISIREGERVLDTRETGHE